MAMLPIPVAETLFLASLFFNLRSVVKSLIEWHGLRAVDRFVHKAYAARSGLPSVEELEQSPQAPIFLHLVAAYHEPAVTKTLSALLALRYPSDRSYVVVITKDEEDRSPHPDMVASTGEIVRRFRDRLPPREQRRLLQWVMPGRGRKAEQLNWALRPEALREALGNDFEGKHVFITVSDADSIPDPDLCRWVFERQRTEKNAFVFQGPPLSVANFENLPIRGRICAIQQSSIFLRFCIARLIHEPARARFAARLRSAPGGRWTAPLFELFFRRSQICLGHNTILRLDALQELGGFPTSGATEDSTLGYAIGRRGWLLTPSPLIELVDLPETPEKVIRQNARWYLGVLDDVGFLWRSWKENPSSYNLGQLVRQFGIKAIEWPTSLLFYPLIGWAGWQLAWNYPHIRIIFYAAIVSPILSIALVFWVCGVVSPSTLAGFQPYFPAPVDLRSRSWLESTLRVARCQGYWLLATFGTWRVLAAALIGMRYEPGKTDRATVPASRAAWRKVSV